MSSWRLLARALNDLGGEATSAQLELKIGGAFAVGGALVQLRQLGLAERVGNWRGRGVRCTWRLTQRGVDWCEGRLTTAGRKGGMRFIATWLASLPRGLRITPPEAPCSTS